MRWQVLGTVTRLTRVQAVLNIISVDGKPCQQDWQGIIRLNDIRSTGKSSRYKYRTDLLMLSPSSSMQARTN